MSLILNELNFQISHRLGVDRIECWRDFNDASEVILFGSQTLGDFRRCSDIDLLVVGGRGRVKTSTLDIIPKSRDEIDSEPWLSSELAAHISSYGIWLKGSGDWKADVRRPSVAVGAKLRRIEETYSALAASWARLSLFYKRRYVARIARDVERLVYLVDDRPVPPTPCLKTSSESGCLEVLRDASRMKLITCGMLTRISDWFTETTFASAELH